ncbi:MAG: GNAT family protein [Candidatus Nanopelagicales bacterium]
MSTLTRAATVLRVPADLTPRWRDLPALAWVLARAYMPGPRWWAVPAAVVSAVVFAAPYLAAVHAVGGLAALATGRARALVIPDARRPAVHAAGLIGFAVSMATVVAAAWVLTQLIYPLPALMASTALLFGSWAAPFIPTLAAGVQRARARARASVGAAPTPMAGDHPAALLGYLASWPQRTGAGAQLISRICVHADLARVEVRLNARNPEAGRLYQRLGFTYDGPGSLGMTRSPTPVAG